MATRYTLHVDKWIKCTKCELHKTRLNVCLVRGVVPCDVLFVGEGPGESEDILGSPFCGPAGQMLDDTVNEAMDGLRSMKGVEYTCAYTNLVGCVPRNEDGGKAEQPKHESIVACASRVEDLVSFCQPKLIVCVGRLAEEYLDQRYKYSVKVGTIPQVHIKHPSAILKGNFAARPLEVKRNIVVLQNALMKIGV